MMQKRRLGLAAADNEGDGTASKKSRIDVSKRSVGARDSISQQTFIQKQWDVQVN
jgi:hypothetical protein